MMEKYLGFVAVSVFLLSCAEAERNNPDDPRAYNYSAVGSSSSVEPSSSSVVFSSSSVEQSSSSVLPSSSGTAPSSSSVVLSSSSVEPSSSGTAPSSSSAVPSSSSALQSSSSVAPSSSSGTFIDTRENKPYKWVKIGTQTWMAENLNYDPGTGNSACYGNQPSNCTTYGRLYDWSTAMNLASDCNSISCLNRIETKHKGICPDGWHIPSQTEWNVMTDYIGGASTEGKKLKATSGWRSYSGIENSDTYGFSALPGGYGLSVSSFSVLGDCGLWWSASEISSNHAYSRYMHYHNDGAYWGDYDKSYLRSVRCLKD